MKKYVRVKKKGEEKRKPSSQHPWGKWVERPPKSSNVERSKKSGSKEAGY